MIDTIIFSIHDLKYHSELKTKLLNLRNRGFESEHKSIELEDFKYGKTNLKRFIDRKRNLKYEWYDGEMQISSGHSSIYFRVNENFDFIYFNFSIPKYLYGHNIAQFGINPKHTVTPNPSFISKTKDLHAQLLNFLKYFFKIEFGVNEANQDGEVSYPLDWAKVLIERVDICFNQYHKDKSSAMNYLDMIRKIHKPNTNEKSYIQNWQSSIVYKTDLFYFKIYHKGEEFARNDSKRLLKHNVTYNKRIHDVDALQNEADKILRYEMQFRGRGMNYIYKKKLFRKSCKLFKRNQKLALKYRSISRMSYTKIRNTFKDFNKSYSENISLIKTQEFLKINLSRLKYVLRNPLEKKKSGIEDHLLLKPDERNFLSMYNHLIDSTTKFWVIAPYHEEKLFHEQTIAGTYLNKNDYCKNYELPNGLLKEFANKFMETSNSLQPKKLPKEQDFYFKLDKINKRAKTENKNKASLYNLLPKDEVAKFKSKGINGNLLKPYIALLELGVPLKDIRKKFNICERTFYRIKKRLKAIGYQDQQISTPILDSVDFTYEHYLMSNLQKPHLFTRL